MGEDEDLPRKRSAATLFMAESVKSIRDSVRGVCKGDDHTREVTRMTQDACSVVISRLRAEQKAPWKT